MQNRCLHNSDIPDRDDRYQKGGAHGKSGCLVPLDGEEVERRRLWT